MLHHLHTTTAVAPQSHVLLTNSATGQVLLKVSPTKRPKLTGRRAASEDWEKSCPTRVGSSLSGTSGKPPLPPSKRAGANSQASPTTVKKPKKSLITHNDADRVRRVNALIAKNEATPGFFLEVIPDEEQTQTADERWFMQVTERKITDGHVLGTWCQANSLISAGTEQHILLSNVKDYGPSSTFMS